MPNAFLGLDPAFGRALRDVRRAPLTPAISALLVGCFAASVALGVDAISPTSEQLLHVGGSFGPRLLDGEWWRLLSAEFLHGGIVHLSFNLWALWGAGQLAERIYGRLGFLAIYVLSAVGATLLSVAVAPLTVSIGASGAIFGVYGALFAVAWFHRSPFRGEFLKQQRQSLLPFLGYNVMIAILDRRIDAAGHAGGFVVGVVLGALLWRDLRDPRSRAAPRAAAVVIVAALLVAAASGVGARVAAVPAVRMPRLIHEAADALGAGQFGVAVEKLSAAIAAHDSSPLRLARAHALSELGRRREALDDAKIAVDLAPADASDALGVRGSLELELGLKEEAARTCGLISNRAPWSTPDVASFAFCAFVYLQRGDPKAALDWAERMVAADQDAAEALRVRAHVLERTGQFDRARADFDRVIEKAPDNTWALNARAWLRLGSEDFAGALDDADRAIAIDPSKAAAIGTRCFARAGLGDAEGASRDCARAVELAPPGTLEDRGMLAFLARDRAAALQLWLEAAPRDPANRRVLAPWIAKARKAPTR